MRNEIRGQMEEGVLNMHPEDEIEEGHVVENKSKVQLSSTSITDQSERSRRTTKKDRKETEGEKKSGEKNRRALDDDFFDAGSNTDSGPSDEDLQ